MDTAMYSTTAQVTENFQEPHVSSDEDEIITSADSNEEELDSLPDSELYASYGGIPMADADCTQCWGQRTSTT
jgi:hypothetical protein